MNLAELLRSTEGKTLEFKRDLSSPERALRSLVAFANSAGGVLLFGVEDKTRRVRGVPNVLAEEERLASLVSDSIAPRILPEIEILPWRRTHVLGIQVHAGPNPPYCLKSLGSDAGVFVRVGSTNRRADRETVEGLRRVAANQSFDELPRPDLDSEAIDFRAASESFAPVRALRRADLRTLHLTARYQGREVPTNGGLLLFGTERLLHFPDAWVQTARFAGVDRKRIADSLAIRAPLIQAVEEAITFVQKHTVREVVIGDVRRAERWTVPPAAIREAIVNAVVHADYSRRGTPIQVALFDDRLELQNPGLLPLGITVDDIRRGVSKLRNHVIGRVFHELGLIEQWGSGVQRMIAECHEAGLDEPSFEEIGTHFRVTLPALRRNARGASPKDRNILDALAEEGGLSTAQVAARIGLSSRGTRTRLAVLVDRGLVAEIGSGPHDPRRRYALVHDGAGE